jgi:hypothetical protein
MEEINKNISEIIEIDHGSITKLMDKLVQLRVTAESDLFDVQLEDLSPNSSW